MKKSQRGIGLMEVLVALLILAIAVLGFVALQLRAVNASIEAGNNIHATNIARDLTERMRINREGIKQYMAAIPSQLTCQVNCNPQQQALNDLYIVDKVAGDAGMSLVVDRCPSSNFKRMCVFVAWGDTVIAKGNLDTAGVGCLESGKTSYQANAQCIMMETYNDE